MTWLEDPEQGMFIMGEIDEPVRFKTAYTKPVTLLFTILGLVIFAAALVVYIFSATIMIFYTLRVDYWNWGYGSLIVALLLFYIGSQIRTRWGFSRLVNKYDSYQIKPFFGKKTIIKKNKIYALTVQNLDALLGIQKAKPFVVISTYDATYKIPLYFYRRQEMLLEYFDQMSGLLQDDYYNIFQKSELTFPSLRQRIWKQPTGKIGVILVGIYVFFALWGAFSMLLYPENLSYSEAFYLKNPELSFSFLPQYDTHTVIYLPPSKTFFLGTDWWGRDIFSRLVYGTVYAFLISIGVALIQIILILIFGLSSLLENTFIDLFIKRVSEILQGIPNIILLIIVATFVGGLSLADQRHYFYIFVAMAFLVWPSGAKLVDSEARRIVSQEYVVAVRRLGASKVRIFWRHLLPKLAPTLVLLFIYTMTEVIISMTMIGLIGLGNASLNWGADLHRAIIFNDPLWDPSYSERWWTIVYPAMWVSGLIVGLTLLSDSIRDQFQLTTSQMGARI